MVGIGLTNFPKTVWLFMVNHCTDLLYRLALQLIFKRSVGPEYEKQILISSCTHSCNSNPSPSAFYGEKSSSAVWKGRLNQSLAHRSVANYLSCSISSNSNDENDHTVQCTMCLQMFISSHFVNFVFDCWWQWCYKNIRW